ncbi:MAG: hypothetical protein ACTSVU_02085 [Promethearchaeota archaeon]
MASYHSKSPSNSQDLEIGLALSHYHHKLGPQFVGISGPLANNFDSISQYNILQDSISSRSLDLALFVKDKKGNPYTIRIKKIKILDPLARGGVQRYAIVLLIPSNLEVFSFDIDEISEDLVDKLSQGANISQSLHAWYTLLNDQYGHIPNQENEVKIVRRLEKSSQSFNIF